MIIDINPNLKPIAEQLLIEPLNEGQNRKQSLSGNIILPDNKNMVIGLARVLKIGPGPKLKNGKRAPHDPDLHEGDIIIYSTFDRVECYDPKNPNRLIGCFLKQSLVISRFDGNPDELDLVDSIG